MLCGIPAAPRASRGRGDCVGGPLRGEDWTEWGGVAGRRYRLALLVPGMGDRNSAFVAQAVHEAALLRAPMRKDARFSLVA